MAPSYRDVYRRSLAEPEQFWLDAATAVDWDQAPDQRAGRLRRSAVPLVSRRQLNTCYNALDRHVADGAGERTALIHHSAHTATGFRVSATPS